VGCSAGLLVRHSRNFGVSARSFSNISTTQHVQKYRPQHIQNIDLQYKMYLPAAQKISAKKIRSVEKVVSACSSTIKISLQQYIHWPAELFLLACSTMFISCTCKYIDLQIDLHYYLYRPALANIGLLYNVYRPPELFILTAHVTSVCHYEHRSPAYDTSFVGGCRPLHPFVESS
jgi:hypothetical protein